MAHSRRNELIEKATTLFAGKGYSETGMRDLAAAMHMEAASLYSHIHSKEELLEKICFAMADRLLIGLDEVNDLYFNAEEKLRMAIRSHINIVCAHPDATKVFVNEWRHLVEPHQTNFIQKRHHYEAAFYQILEEGEHEQMFRETEHRFAVLTILSTVNWVHTWYNKEGSMTPDEIADKLSEFILNGLKK